MRFQSITKKQMSLIDRLMVKEGMSVPRMMELAGLETALLASGVCAGKKVVVLCGKGNNGGDGIAAARHLANFGFSPKLIFPFNPKKIVGEAKSQLAITGKMKIPAIDHSLQKAKAVRAIKASGLIIDALMGYNLAGNPREEFASLIEAANSSGRKILSIDLPSGLDATSGKAFRPCIRASATICLTLPKKGVLTRSGKEFSGRIFVGYLSVPQSVFRRADLKAFAWNPKELVQKL